MSNFSLNVFRSVYLNDGIRDIRDLFKEFSKRGVKALGICNQGNLISVIKFHEEAIAYGIKPIIGMQVEIVSEIKGVANDSLQLFAFNMTGYFNLVSLASRAKFDGSRLKLANSQELLDKHHAGLICFAGDSNSSIYRYLANYHFDEAKTVAKFYADLFGRENFYLEVQSKEDTSHLHLNQMLIQIARNLEIPIIATKKIINAGELSNRCKYIYPDFDTGIPSEHERFNPDEKIDFDLVVLNFYCTDEDENLNNMTFAEEVIENTQLFLNKINFEDDFSKKYYPRFETPAEIGDMEYLEAITLAGLKTHYPQVEGIHLKQLKYELEVINKKGWAYFFFLYGSICSFAKENGFYVSGTYGQFEGSLVAYVLDFTNIDPLRFGLVFDLFLRKNRPYNMNIVIDANKEKHPFIVNYFYQMYGENNVSKIIYTDGGSTRPERRLRVVAQAFKVPREKIYRFAKMFYSKFARTKPNQLNNEFKLRQWCESDPQAQGLMNIALHIYNRALPIEDECHLLLSNGMINNQMPVFQSKYGLAAQYSNFEIKDFHLLKVYIEDKGYFSDERLIDQTLVLIAETRKIRIDINEIPRNDQAVFAMITSGALKGLPYFYHDRSFEHIVKRVKLDTLEDFIFMVNLNYRNYMEHNGKPYISNRNGSAEIRNECSSLWLAHPVLGSILRETAGYIFYEEQVINIAKSIAGFSLWEANEFLLSTHLKPIESTEYQLNKKNYHKKFIKGCLANGMTTELAEEIYFEMTAFWKSSKSYMVSMALPAYQLAYLKCHYPEEFLSAYYTLIMNTHNGYIEEFASECQRLQIEILRPDLNESLWDLKPAPGQIRLGFSVIKHTAKRAIEELIRVRRSGPFLNLEDFCERCAKHQGDLATFEALTSAGCFDFFGHSKNKTIVKIMLAIELFDIKNTDTPTH